jgi:hypothetical protein
MLRRNGEFPEAINGHMRRPRIARFSHGRLCRGSGIFSAHRALNPHSAPTFPRLSFAGGRLSLWLSEVPKEAEKPMQSDSEPVFDDSRVLPLFRPEAVAAQQKKLEGEMLRIYPFSAVFLVVMAGIVLVCLLGIFQLGRTLL